jgi:GNAT superfamily N-acetyltransferase
LKNKGLQISPARLEPDLYRVKPGFGEQQCQARMKWLTTVNGEWLVGAMGIALVGWVVVTWSGKQTHTDYPDMSDLFVGEEWRNRGIGTALIGYIERLAQQNNCGKIGLSVNPDLNAQAQSLYLRLGYRHDGRAKYVDGVYDGVEDWVIDLEKVL